jgi:hypothetical protein
LRNIIWFLDLGFRSATVNFVAHYWATEEFDKVSEVANTGITYACINCGRHLHDRRHRWALPGSLLPNLGRLPFVVLHAGAASVDELVHQRGLQLV